MDALKRAQGAFAFYHLPDTARMLVALERARRGRGF
jgi:hypothetical protein